MTMFFTREPYLVCFIHKLYHLFIKLSFHSKIYLRLQLFPGKNPRPICVPVPRFQFIKACVRFYNIYFQGRNIHTCVNMEGKFRDTTIFKVRYRLRQIPRAKQKKEMSLFLFYANNAYIFRSVQIALDSVQTVWHW